MGSFLNIVLVNSLTKIKECDYMATQTQSLTQKGSRARAAVTSSRDFTITIDFAWRYSDGTVMDSGIKP